MRRRAAVTTLVIALTLTPLLGACSLLQRLPLPGVPGPASSAGPLGIGSCLDGMVGADSDRAATVPCGEPHLYEVTAIEEWPGMADALTAAGDAGALWDDIHAVDGSSPTAIEYGMWASRTCNEAGQRMIGVAGVEVEGLTAGELWLRIGGSHGVDLSLASRDAFVAGDHRTVCALAWYRNRESPERVEGPRFSELLSPGLPIDRRECWDSDYYSVSCARPHAVQALAGFDGIAAFGGGPHRPYCGGRAHGCRLEHRRRLLRGTAAADVTSQREPRRPRLSRRGRRGHGMGCVRGEGRPRGQLPVLLPRGRPAGR